MDNLSRLKDAEIAVNVYGWRWEKIHSRTILIPPEGDPKEHWTAMWDKDGIPHYLPKYSEIEEI